MEFTFIVNDYKHLTLGDKKKRGFAKFIILRYLISNNQN